MAQTTTKQTRDVLIVGGGVSGLTAAHELVERGYTVTVLDASHERGGKSRSIGAAGTGTDGRADLPGEHGFRFFAHSLGGRGRGAGQLGQHHAHPGLVPQRPGGFAQ